MSISYNSHPFGLLSYTSTTPKVVRGSNGLLGFVAHNLFLSSNAPATQTVTVVSGATYTVSVTGAGSVALTGAGVGTATQAASFSFTASTTSLVCTCTAPLLTVQVRRTPSDSTYIATTSAAACALPFEWNTSGALEGILCEPSSTNLALYSKSLSTLPWGTFAAAVTANAATAPDGTTTATKIIANTTPATAHIIFQGLTLTAASHTFSVSLKAAEYTWAYLEFRANDFTPFCSIYINLATGAVGATSGTFTSTVENQGNGWWRLSITTTATAEAWTTIIGPSPSNGGATFTGDGVSGIYATDAQVEAKEFATSLIPTYAATATRAADAITLAVSSFPLSATSGTLYSEVKRKIATNPTTIGFGALALVGTAGNNIAIRQVATSGSSFADSFGTVGGVVQWDSADDAVSANVVIKKAVAYQANDIATCTNGGAVSADSSATIPTVSTLWLNGGSGGVAEAAPSYIRKAAYISRRMTNAEIQALTT